MSQGKKWGADAFAQQMSSIVALSNIVPRTQTPGRNGAAANSNCLVYRSRAVHAIRIRSIAWRPSDALEECVVLERTRAVSCGFVGLTFRQSRSSGPVLFTQTVDGIFRIWGCVIDEPDFFSLWCSLDVHSTLPRQLPLATLYWRTREMVHRKGKSASGGTADEFVTVFSDGAVHLTTVSVSHAQGIGLPHPGVECVH